MLVWELMRGDSRAETGASPQCLRALGGQELLQGAHRPPLTPGHRGDNLAEGATAQLVLGQDAELVA